VASRLEEKIRGHKGRPPSRGLSNLSSVLEGPRSGELLPSGEPYGRQTGESQGDQAARREGAVGARDDPTRPASRCSAEDARTRPRCLNDGCRTAGAAA
jgi:hypothetical protein